jgi:outer membrane PBP1 activator LpoA protein
MRLTQEKNLKHLLMSGLAVLVLAGCKPGPPPDIAEGPRKGLEKAKALEGQMQQQSEERKKSVDAQEN